MEINGQEGHRHEESSSEWFVKYLKHQGDWLEKTRGNLMVTATVIAGMSFQVMVNPPGGVWQSDNCSFGNQTGTAPVCKGKAGTAVLEYESSKRIAYLGMVISSTVSFSASMSLILLVISGIRLRNRMIMAILVTFMVVAVLCISAAFFFTIVLVGLFVSCVVVVVNVGDGPLNGCCHWLHLRPIKKRRNPWEQVSASVFLGTKQGHYVLVIRAHDSSGRGSTLVTPPSSPAVNDGGGGRLAVGSVIGSMIGAFLLRLLVVAMVVKGEKKTMREEMERRAYEEEALPVSMVGHVRANPNASRTRTVPRFDNTRYSKSVTSINNRKLGRSSLI
ncbi:unnamed protein product [Arabidopsis lyrata]|nr:unnamed protein product [Arabidopsis lyrata]